MTDEELNETQTTEAAEAAEPAAQAAEPEAAPAPEAPAEEAKAEEPAKSEPAESAAPAGKKVSACCKASVKDVSLTYKTSGFVGICSKCGKALRPGSIIK